MSFSETISKLKSAMEISRGEIDDICAKISELENERIVVIRRPAHTDDIVAVFQRGLADSQRDFEEQFKRELSASFVNDEAAAESAKPGRARDIIRLPEQKLSQAEVQDMAIQHKLPGINPTVLLYFLREQIGAELPGLVERLCPASHSGIKAKERAEVLARIDAELAALRFRRDAMVAELAQARQIVLR